MFMVDGKIITPALNTAILAGVTSSVNGMGGIIKGLDSRVDTMTNQLQRIDVKVSHALGLQPDYDRISRAEQADQRKD